MDEEKELQRLIQQHTTYDDMDRKEVCCHCQALGDAKTYRDGVCRPCQRQRLPGWSEQGEQRRLRKPPFTFQSHEVTFETVKLFLAIILSLCIATYWRLTCIPE